MTKAASDTQKNERKHDAGQLRVRAAFSGSKPGANAATKLDRKRHPGHAQDAEHHGRQRGHLVRQLPRGLIAAAHDGFAKSGDECRRQRAFGEQIAQQVGNAKRGRKASIALPPPNRAAKICSRASPSRRLPHHRDADNPRALVFSFSVGSSGATGGSEDRSFMRRSLPKGARHVVANIPATVTAITAVAIHPSRRNRGRMTNRPMMSSRDASSIMTAMMGTAMTPLI